MLIVQMGQSQPANVEADSTKILSEIRLVVWFILNKQIMNLSNKKRWLHLCTLILNI